MKDVLSMIVFVGGVLILIAIGVAVCISFSDNTIMFVLGAFVWVVLFGLWFELCHYIEYGIWVSPRKNS
jgi:hypothetical protein